VENVLDEAIKAALGRRGVAHVTIPKDIQEWETSGDHRSEMNVKDHSADFFAPNSPLPSQARLQQAADLINQGSKVVLLAGRGALCARKEVLQLAERVGGVVIKPLLGKAV